jgi:hypothetical protein
MFLESAQHMSNRVSPRELESLRSLFSRNLKMCHLVDPRSA